MKPGVTQQLLWMEYCDKYRDEGEIPYQLTAFKRHYREYAAQTKATMHIKRKPGEIMEVDWAGQTAQITDCDTSEALDAYVFVALPREPFELASWKIATVAFNYHIGVDEQFYSVPFEFIKWSSSVLKSVSA